LSEIDLYRQSVLHETALDLFIDRKFMTSESWDKLSSEEAFRFRGMFRESEPGLPAVLEHSRVLILAEPGAGKSTIAKQIAYTTAEEEKCLPIFAALAGYRGDLAGFLSTLVPKPILQGDSGRQYVFDGLDELPTAYAPRFVEDLTALMRRDPLARWVITSRQAFYSAHPELVPAGFSVFHILEFNDNDVRKYIQHAGIGVASFTEAVKNADLSDETRNPFILDVLCQRFKELGALSPLRYENISYVIEQLLRRRRVVNPLRLRRALRMLALANETYARNELTTVEALQVLSAAMDESEQQARTILDELFQSILVDTANGLTFHMRSHAEYLAAEELSHQASLERIKQLAFFEDDTPNDSWLNTISYLAEMHAGVRRLFLNNYPEWMLASWPSAFSPEEKHVLVQNLLTALRRSDQYLVNHPTIRLWQLGRFLTELDRAELLVQFASENSVVSANAMVLLSSIGEASILPRARAIVRDTKRGDPTRYSGIISLINLKDRAAIDELIGILDRADPYYASVLDLIGGVSDPEDLPKVLSVILDTNVGLSATHLRFREFVSAAAVRVSLSYLSTHPSTMASFRGQSYLAPMIEAIPEYWDDEIARLSAELLITLESNHVYPQPSELTADFMKAVALADKDHRFLRRALSHYVATATEPHFYAHWLGSQVTVEIAEWLVASKATRLIQRLSPSIFNENVRQVLRPAAGGYIDAQEENWRQYERGERDRKGREQTEKEAVQQVLLTEMNFGRVVTKFYQTKPEYWPDLPDERAEWILQGVSRALTSLDLKKNIFMGEGTSWSSPTWLRILLSVIDYYNFAIPNDVELINALRAWPETAIVNHYRRNGISSEAAQKLESMLRDQGLHEHMLSNALSFLEHTSYLPARFVELLKELVVSGQRSDSLRFRAIDLIGGDPESTRFLASLYKRESDGAMRDRLFLILVRQQYRPVIEASLSVLLKSDDALREAESGSHIPYDDSPVSWITKIQMPELWNKLKKLRQRTLELALPNVCGLTTQTLKKLDPAELPSVIRTQVTFAPPTWRPQQRALAIEYEREGRILRARSTPFETVLAKLKVTSSMLALRVWCEGRKDRDILRALLREFGENELANSVRLVGGWPNLLAEDEPDQWLTGCRRAVFIMDGDRGRNMSHPGGPYSDEAKEAFRRFEGHALKLYVLERYGIENYIPRAVYERVLGRDLAAYFPLPLTTPVEEHFVEQAGRARTRLYSKSMNSRVAAVITMKDIAGTDLERILLEISEQSRKLAG
jgi:hypothetical protein